MVDAVPTALIADVIGSRAGGERAEVQRGVEQLLLRVSEVEAPLQPFTATVGDEFQAVYSSRNGALRATLYASLLAEENADLRFGLGEGAVSDVPSGMSARIQDGPGWWRAREAVEEAEQRQRKFPFLRTWFVGAEGSSGVITNAYLMSRDRLLSQLGVSARNYARGIVEGSSQKEIAQQYGVSQPAVSKLLRESGAQVALEGFKMLA